MHHKGWHKKRSKGIQRRWEYECIVAKKDEKLEQAHNNVHWGYLTANPDQLNWLTAMLTEISVTNLPSMMFPLIFSYVPHKLTLVVG